MGNQFFQKIVHLYNSNKLPYAIIASGSALRLVQYFHNRSLWLDEASLALNILDTSFLGLVRPLKFVQAAPIGFLWTEKLAVTIFNGNEYTLRLFPLLSGIISLFLFYGVAKRFLKQEAVPIALCLFAILKPLIYYSSEVKQYSSDVLITILIYYYFSKYIYSKRLTASKILWFGMLGAFAVWFSHPSLFILAGVGSVLMLSSIIKKQWKETGFHIIICSFWLISLELNYFVSLRALTRNKHFLTGWAGAFVPSSISSAYDVKWFTSHFFHIFSDTMGFSLSGIAALAFLIGAVSIFQKKRINFLS